MRKLAIVTIFLTLFLTHDAIRNTHEAYANNISVSNGALGTQNTTANTEVIQFDISWENSWRTSTAPSNYDAAWVFIKYSTDGGSTWSHATLKTAGTNPADTNIGTGTGIAIIVPTDKKGAFIQRSANGLGTLSTTGIQLTWDYGTDGVSDTDANDIDTVVRVMAIEMVYIPTGSFDLGDGSGSAESTNAFHVTDNTGVGTIGTTLVQNIKVDVNTYDDDQIEITGIGIDGDGGIDSDNDGVIDNASFPTGYNAFYLMKYEVSHGQYADFLNMLTRTQQNTRTGTNVSTDAITNIYVMSNTATLTYRSTITCPASGNGTTAPITFSTTTPNRAGNYLNWMDLAAYADWAGLRPMTELEYEKASRGPSTAVNLEYAWGNTSIHNAAYSITNDGAANATITSQPTGTGNASYGTTDGSIDGPLRCGIFAQSGTSRQESGASYYGVMELSGNLWERPVTVGNGAPAAFGGRNFTGSHGNGSLTSDGYADNSDWPGYVTSKVSGATGSGFRGGGWAYDATYARVSDRYYAANTNTNRYYFYGGRCARTSP